MNCHNTIWSPSIAYPQSKAEAKSLSFKTTINSFDGFRRKSKPKKLDNDCKVIKSDIGELNLRHKIQIEESKREIINLINYTKHPLSVILKNPRVFKEYVLEQLQLCVSHYFITIILFNI